MNAQAKLARNGFGAAIVFACESAEDRLFYLELLDAALTELLLRGDDRYAIDARAMQAMIRQELPANPAALKFAENVVYVNPERWREASTPHGGRSE
jgi:hypothetical protein